VTPLTGPSCRHQVAEHHAILVDGDKAQVWSVAIGLTDQMMSRASCCEDQDGGCEDRQGDDGRRLPGFAGHVKVSTDELDGHASPWRG
jgi:hypothetical protein